jgi:hypothetical protein
VLIDPTKVCPSGSNCYFMGSSNLLDCDVRAAVILTIFAKQWPREKCGKCVLCSDEIAQSSLTVRLKCMNSHLAHASCASANMRNRSIKCEICNWAPDSSLNARQIFLTSINQRSQLPPVSASNSNLHAKPVNSTFVTTQACECKGRCGDDCECKKEVLTCIAACKCNCETKIDAEKK